MKILLFLSFLWVNVFVFSQFNASFQSAYTAYPNLPEGVLEAVAWSNTHMRNISIEEEESCTGIPRALGVMGLFYDGKDYFRENGNLIVELSGISAQEQLSNPDQQILAYAQAFHLIYSDYLTATESTSKALYYTLNALSEIPDDGGINNFALDAQIYQVLRYMNDAEFAQKHSFVVNNHDLDSVFGTENLKVLSASKITISEQSISNDLGESYSIPSLRNAEYGQAVWDSVPSCNYNSRNGVAISAIAVHTIQGSYAGAISWAKNCDSNVSYHYVIRSSDGQVAQLVLEQHKAWHIGSENPYTIGYEHEGWVDDASWYTQAMYESSAELTKDIVHNRSYGIPALRTYYGAASLGINVIGGCTKIKGHQHFPNQNHTDPGIHWNWEKYYQLINDNPSVTTVTSTSGTLYDTGGPTGDYGNDERELWLIQPAGASSVSINFTEFQLEE
ncbi:MAG TPA: N-acetylmuramoyl-L-alanine amidase, partial [Brumimicrobium sp.]|nr:N-acetylmuramoyl-L-alanine amidase [Brumimicrobium sp.]